MREIRPRAEPAEFAYWRAASRTDVNFGYDLIPSDLRRIIKESLISAQRGLCAYTGIRIDESRAHIEHLLPQEHCRRGEEDVAYRNMAACLPGPNSAHVPFGAIRKANWPSREEAHLFVSPYSPGCEDRFHFDLRGRISVGPGDEAARETVKRIGLDHERLESLRREAIQATLNKLDLESARRRLNHLEIAESAEEGLLEPFCFALKQALRKHIVRLQSIRASKGRRAQHGQ